MVNAWTSLFAPEWWKDKSLSFNLLDLWLSVSVA